MSWIEEQSKKGSVPATLKICKQDIKKPQQNLNGTKHTAMIHSGPILALYDIPMNMPELVSFCWVQF